ncbi:MAG: hypothetical protein ACPL3B_00150 [Fervidobacterium sp.]
MRELRPSELIAILKELKKQTFLQEYLEMRNKWGFIASTIVNSITSIAGMFSKSKPKQVNPDDFLSDEFKKRFKELTGEQLNEGQWDKLIEEAKEKGLRGPW